jgi:hypothetical protein
MAFAEPDGLLPTVSQVAMAGTAETCDALPAGSSERVLA